MVKFQDDNNTQRNESDATFQDTFNSDGEKGASTSTARDLQQSEANPNTPQTSSRLDDANSATRSDENAPSFYRPVSKYGGTKSKWGRGLSVNNKNALLKRGGPIALIVALLGVGGFGIAGLFALMPIHVLENLVSKFNTQNTSLTIRTNKVLAAKMSGSATSGSCNVVKIACRFSRPSNTFLNRLAKQGIVAKAADGSVISGSDGKWINKIPKTYEYSTGNATKSITADKFYSTLVNDSDFRAGFHAAYNPLYAGFNDIKAKIVKVLNGVNYRDSLDGVKDPDDAEKALSEKSAGPDTGAAEAEKAGGSATGDVAENEIQELVEKEAKTLEKVGKKGGNGVGLVAGGVCVLADTPQLIASSVSMYEKLQEIKFAVPILTALSKIKAGDASESEANAWSNYLTKTDKNNKSALDSFGLKSAFGEATVPAKNDPYIKFSPGASIYGTLSSTLKVTDSPVRQQACAVATNPATGVALDVGLAANAGETFGASLLAAVINAGVGAIGAGLISFVMPLVSPAISSVGQAILGHFLGNLTSNLTGEDAGNALTSGASNFMAETASAGGNVPLTPNEAVAYNSNTQAVQLAYAKEDQATLSPFDATSQYTALGSFVNNLIPYISNFGSLSGIFSSIKNVAFSPMSILSSLTGVKAASSDQYQLCADPNLQGVATGPFCNVIYGIPDQYINMDPNQVIDYMVSNNDIDEDTGDPIPGSDYADWMDLCLEGGSDGSVDNSDTTQTKNCAIDTSTTDQATKTANDKNGTFAVYTIDYRIQTQMDNDTGNDAGDSE